MPLILPGNVASATAAVGYNVANSCRFNDGDSAKMSKSLGTATDNQKWTINVWVKLGQLGTNRAIWTSRPGTSGNYVNCIFNDDDKIYIYGPQVNGENDFGYITNRLFRDPSAWYCLTFAMDTTLGTAGDRLRIYVNGVEETSFATETNPTQNLIYGANYTGYTFVVGARTDDSEFFDGYQAEFCMIDGQQLTPTSFGEFDSDSPSIWKPIDVSGLTFGDNGFYLDFEASGNLGNDANGGTDLTEANLAAADQSTDSPTNNFATGNPLNWGTSWSGSLSNGNNTLTGSSSSNTYNTLFSTIAVNTGKWYAEFKITTSDMNFLLGVSTPEAAQISAQTNKIPSSTYISTGHGYGLSLADGVLYFQNNGSVGQTDISGDGSQNDIIGIYLDLDNNKLYFGLNGTVLASGVGETIVNDYYHFHAGDGAAGAAASGQMNFGANGAFGDTAVSSAVADTNGYGAFEYDPSAGTFDSASKNFLALCTKNVAEEG